MGQAWDAMLAQDSSPGGTCPFLSVLDRIDGSDVLHAWNQIFLRGVRRSTQ
jgi:hypothetical protein